VPLRGYTALYGLAVFELHEAFHGRHPGIAWLHGHQPFRVEIAYGGMPGNVVFIGKALPEVRTVGDILDRLAAFTGLGHESEMLELECRHRGCSGILETNISATARILSGSREDKVGTILHFFPHTGFTPAHLKQAKKEHPEIDTAVVSISSVREDSPLVQTAKELGLAMLVGNSHALEILENGLPLAYALQHLLPGVEVVIFRERVTSTPLEMMGSQEIRQYARRMALEHLLKKTA
jgi:hypothetical protein